MSSIVGKEQQKLGLVYDDHHYKTDGRYERSPPSKLKAMYDYLPTEMVATSSKHIPMKICLVGENPESNCATLKSQVQCLGVYAKVPNRETNGYPMWKHVDADLCIACAKIDGNDGWVVAQYTTWHDDRQHKCMQLEGAAPPWSSKNSNTWQAWTGRQWDNATGIHCRPTYHGWGRDGVGQWSNTESSVSPPRMGSGSPKKKSPGGSPS
ncbi:hypothetical protein Ctob_003274 [Chrysochromulina tobinii]|jgi:hypothetical protein|uniref:Uncharacterized protein n=1 Tax=Chrysochromulina tobinii TaxID=1460289 RepID=A0A0M0JCK5_9EUKA|nr:hypothetical protein Ctob_003274 [Chrysochromulina tobinii]|eukprot:KOO24082.1 hypothetical protein Ctob_003274 [Chrysochromulina sp. CCMP291]